MSAYPSVWAGILGIGQVVLDPKRLEKQPYDKVKVPWGDAGAWREVARYTCKCGNEMDIPIRSGSGMSFDQHRKYLTQRDWEASANCLTVVCPSCSKRSGSAARARQKWHLPEPEPQVILGPEPLPEPPPEPVTVEVQPAEATQPMSKPSPAQPMSKPSPAQRLQMRRLLDKFFDDAEGAYLEGASDESIAGDLQVPVAWVSEIRDAAYGPIRVTPEMLTLRADIDRAQTRSAALAAQLVELVGKVNELQTEIDALKTRANPKRVDEAA